jgi:hypothetical protein
MQFKFIFEKIYERNKLISIFDIVKSYEVSTKTLIFIVKSFIHTPIFYLVCFSFVFVILAIILKVIKNIKSEISIAEKTMNTLIYISIPLVLYLSLWGPFILLHEKFFNPRDYIVVGAILMLSMYSVLLAGNILKYDNQYMNYVNNNISRDMEKYHSELKDKKIFVFGRQGMSRYAQKTVNNNPYFKILLYPDNSNFFKSYDLYVKGVEKFGYVDNVKEWNYICKKNIKPLVSTPTYEIYSFEKYVSIWYKRTDDFCENIPTDLTNSFKELK